MPTSKTPKAVKGWAIEQFGMILWWTVGRTRKDSWDSAVLWLGETKEVMQTPTYGYRCIRVLITPIQ